MGSKLFLSLPGELSGLSASASILDRSLAVVRRTTLGRPASDIELDPGIYAARAVLPDGRSFEAAFEIPATANVIDVTLNAVVDPNDGLDRGSPIGTGPSPEPRLGNGNAGGLDSTFFHLGLPRGDAVGTVGAADDFPPSLASFTAPELDLVMLDASGRISSQEDIRADASGVFHVDRQDKGRFVRIVRAGAPDLYVAAPTSAAEALEIRPSSVRSSGFEFKLEDEHADLLLRYLAGGRHQQLTALVSDGWLEAAALPEGKHLKPVAAAVGAYAVLVVGRPDTDETGYLRPGDVFDRWTGNLVERHPWLVDGLCIRAELLARRGDHRGALDILLELRLRGLPLFSNGLRYVLDRLTSYRTAAMGGKLDLTFVEGIDAVLDTLFRTATGVDFDSVILTFEARSGPEHDAARWPRGDLTPVAETNHGGLLMSATSNGEDDNPVLDPDDALRGIPAGEIETDDEPLPSPAPADSGSPAGRQPVRYKIVPDGEPQAAGTRYSVTDLDTGATFYAGKVLKYKSRRGLSRVSDQLLYDRFAAEQQIGLWSHFMWPSVIAESNGRYISINAWDRAQFTWGFYQLAAHTPRDNLILLMRELVKLESAKRYFPDLTLLGGKVARITEAGPVSLEREQEVQVGGGKEMQLVDFMTYLNPSSFRMDEREVVNAAKFAAWAAEDRAMRDATVSVSVAIMKRKIRTRAAAFGLFGKRPELAIWISDMFHQGRGSVSQAKAALALPTLEEQLGALSRIDATGQHAARLESVRHSVRILLDEKRFEGVRFGEGALALDPP